MLIILFTVIKQIVLIWNDDGWSYRRLKKLDKEKVYNFVVFVKYYYDEQYEQDEIDESRVQHGRQEKCLQVFGLK
jgi:hypothetical protein